MYGSIHTHFESRYDTANNLSEMCNEFKKLGCKKVAVTEHGVFSSFEDLRDISGEMEDFEIIPGVEGYFGDNANHIVLVAKNYNGYLSLCKIITESNRNTIKGKPIITLENLGKNVSKGDVICTSACVGGIFSPFLGLERYDLEHEKERLEKAIEESDYYNIQAIEEQYKALQKKATMNLARKKANAQKAYEKYRNATALQNVLLLEKEQQDAADELALNKKMYEANHEMLSALNRKRFGAKVTRLADITETLKNFPTEEQLFKKARTLYNKLTHTFGKKDFYFELQNHGLENERIVYTNLIRFAEFVGHDNFIASNDIHIGLTKENGEKYREAVLKRNVVQFTRFTSYSPIQDDDWEYYIKTDEELKKELAKIIDNEAIIDNAISNIEHALSGCSVDFPKNQKFYPKLCDDENAELERLVAEGIKNRFPNGFPDERYEKRVRYELDVIKTMGFAGYHLIVADYLKYARLLGYLPDSMIPDAPYSIEEIEKIIKDNNIECIGYNIGPGRGSCAGSIVAYTLGITDIDPIPYDLLFERFLNTERVSMPDVDSDFKPSVREKAIEYCKHKYGADCVCQIMTKGYGSIKGNLRLAARYLGAKSYQEDQEAEKLREEVDEFYNSDPQGDSRSNPKFAYIRKKIDEYLNPWYAIADKLSALVADGEVPAGSYTEREEAVIALAKSLDGVFLNYGQHAAGTIISSTSIENVLPLMWNESKMNMETQCTMAQAEAKGLLKMDFLGLKNLAIITEIMRKAHDNKLLDVTLREKILAEKGIYTDIFAKGLTQGVFQFESPGMKKMLMEFQPECFEDLILLVAAYRPGPLDYIPEIIQWKWYNKGRRIGTPPKKSITLKNDTLDEILSPTYGCPIYQEQIMQIFQRMAGYSLGGADVVRRYMSKKKEDKLAKEREAFIYGDESRNIPGCVKLQGITPKEAEALFEQMMPFARYGFNKSHATAYALVAFFTAYLKYHYPAIFFAESLNNTAAIDEIYGFVQEMRNPYFNIDLVPPSMLHSENDFVAKGNSVIFGLSFIKGLSEEEFIRVAKLEEFIQSNYHLRAGTIEKYIMAGLFDEYDSNRQKLQEWFVSNDNGKNLLKIATLKEELGELYEMAEIDKKIANAISSIEKKINTLEAKIEPLSMYDVVKPDTLKNRQWENDYLGCVFSITDSMALLRKQASATTFDALESKAARVDAIVLSCSKEKTTKSGLTTYHDVLLQDRNGNRIVRRFDQPVHVLEGNFYLCSDAERFFTNYVKNIKPIRVKEYFLRKDIAVEALSILTSEKGSVHVRVQDNDMFAIDTTEEKIKEMEAAYQDPGFYLDFGG